MLPAAQGSFCVLLPLLKAAEAKSLTYKAVFAVVQTAVPWPVEQGMALARLLRDINKPSARSSFSATKLLLKACCVARLLYRAVCNAERNAVAC